MTDIKKLLIAALAVTVMLTAIPAMAQAVTYTITAGSQAGGTISPSGAVTVTSGTNQNFIITVNSSYDIIPISVDSTNQYTPIPTAQSNVFQYTFNNVTANHNISAMFYTSSPSGGAPQITSQPGNMTVIPGAAATFAVSATGSSLSYQWYKSTNSGNTFIAIGGATSASYTTPPTTIFDNGTEFVCEVYNSHAFVATNAVTLTVFAAPANPYVKVQGRQLVADFTGNGNYQPYVIRGVGYNPTPIGRYSSDWGYYVSATNPNPGNLPNNMLADDVNILNRDFSLLQQMNANTIRIWGGDNTTETGSNWPVSATTFENAFPLQAHSYGDNIYNWLLQNNYVTGAGYINVSLTSSTVLSALQAEFTDPGEYNTILDVLRKAYYGEVYPGRFPNMITPATLDRANYYGLKMIAGFWVGPFGSCNYPNQTKTCVYSLNTYNGDSNDPGLNAPFDLTSPYITNDILMRFENYVNTFKNRPEILFWAIGNENNLSFDPNNPDPNFNTPAQIRAWYALVNQMAAAAHAIEGANYHPVVVINGDDNFQTLGQSIYGADDTSLSNVDIWGVNIYRGQSFYNFFVQYKSLSQKPLWVSEYGIDAWKSRNTANPAVGCDVNDPYGSIPALLNQPANDEADQAAWDGGLWNEIAGNGDISIGGTVMEYSDNWWQPNDWICANLPYSSYGDPTYCHFNHFYFGEGPNSSWPPNQNPNSLLPATPDNYSNESWYGLMGISNSFPEQQADTMIPRQAYTTLKGEFLNSVNNVAMPSYLVLPIQGTSLTSTSATFAWSHGIGVSQYRLLIGTTAGASDVYSYTGTSTSAAVTGIPLTGGTLYVQLGSYINGAWPTNSYTFPTITPYQQWRIANFTAAQLADPSISGNTAAPAGDHIYNIFKYAFGLNPFTSYPSAYNFYMLDNNFTIVYQKNTNATDVTIQVGARASLVSGSWSYLTPTCTTINSSTQSCTATDVDAGSMGFFAIFVSIQGNPVVPAALSVSASNTYYSLTVSNQVQGTVTSASGSINCGSNCTTKGLQGTTDTLTAQPAVGYQFTGWGGACSGAQNTCTVTYNSTLNVSATFSPITYVIKTSWVAGEGFINPPGIQNPSGTVSVNYGANQTFIVVANPGYFISGVTIDGFISPSRFPPCRTYIYTFKNVTANHTIAATFTAGFNITASVGSPGGTISPSGIVYAPQMSNQTFTATPIPGYVVNPVWVIDGVNVHVYGGDSFTFYLVQTNHTIQVKFELSGSST